MRKMSAVVTVSMLMLAPAVSVRADPEGTYPNANYSVFLQAIAGDDIVMDS